MARLPDVPIDAWIADQQELLQKKIAGLFPALEFKTAAMDLNAEIPYDYPYTGGEDTYEEDLRRARELELRQQQADAERRAREDEMLRQAMEQQAEQARQEELRQQTYQQAMSLGIPTPDTVLGMFQGVEGTRPGMGDPTAGTGAFDPGIAPYDESGPREQTSLERSRYDLSEPEIRDPYQGIQTADDFRSYASSLDAGIPEWRDQDATRLPTPTVSPERLTDGIRPIVDRGGEILAWMKDTAVRGAQSALPEPYRDAMGVREDDYGRVRSEPGEPDYVRPRRYGEATSTERRKMQDARKEWDEAQGFLPSAAAGINVFKNEADAIQARYDPVFIPALTKSGIIETDWSPEKRARVEDLIRRQFMARDSGDPSLFTEADAAELEAAWQQVDDRYEQIKDQPDQVMRYYEAAPGSLLLPLIAPFGAAKAGGIAKAGITAAGTRAGMSAQAAGRAGYAADVAIQSTVDPTNLVSQPGVDAAIEGVKGIASATRDALRSEPIRRVAGAIDRGIGRAYDELRGANLGVERTDERAIVSPEHRRRLVPEVRLPAPGSEERRLLEEAVIPVDGKVSDTEGVTLGVTRAFDRQRSGEPTRRGGVFTEPIPEGGTSSYESPTDIGVGGSTVLPRTETTYRSPLIVKGGEYEDHLANAMQALGVRFAPTERLRQILEKAKQTDIRQASARSRDPEGEAIRVENQYGEMFEDNPYGTILGAVSFLRQRFKGRLLAEALREYTKSFGGNPDDIEKALKTPALEGELGWVVAENVVGTYGRRAGYDGMLVIGPDYRGDRFRPAILETLDFHLNTLPSEPARQPRFEALRQSFDEAEAALDDAAEAFAEEYGRYPDPTADVREFNPDLEDAFDLRQSDPVGVAWFEARRRYAQALRLLKKVKDDEKYVPGARPGYTVYPEVEARAGSEPFPDMQEQPVARVGAADLKGIREVALQAQESGEYAPTFFSQLRQTIDQKMPNRASAAQVRGLLKGSPVKPDEIKWTGFDDFLAQAEKEGRPVTKQEVQEFLTQNDVKVEEVLYDVPRRELRNFATYAREEYGWTDEQINEAWNAPFGEQAEPSGESLPRHEGMVGYYDNALVNEANKLGKKFGAQAIPDYVENEGNPAWIMDITEPMRRSVLYQGQPKFVANPGTGTRAVDLARRSLQARGTAGAVSGAVTGAAAEDPDGETTVGDRLRNAAIGAVVGNIGAQRGTMEAARLVDSLIAKGRLSADVLSGHPEMADRIRALYALAAKNLPDDAEVEIPGIVRVLAKLEPAVRQEVEPLINGIKSAGEIRRILAETASPARLGEEARSLVIDLVAGTGRRRARGHEYAADQRALRLETERAFSDAVGQSPAPLGEGGQPRVFDTPYGRATESRDGSILGFVGRVADQLGIARPHVFVLKSGEPMAFATQAGDEPSIMLSEGLMKLDLDADEMRALLAHELAHTTEQSFGMELLGKAGEALRAVKSRLWDDAPFPTELQPEQMAGVVRKTFAGREVTVPEDGPWKTRIETKPEVPASVAPHTAANIERAFNEAMRHLANAQNPNLQPGSKKQERYLLQAEEAWKTYADLYRKATGTNPFVSERTARRGRAVGSRSTPKPVPDPAPVRSVPDELSVAEPGTGPGVEEVPGAVPEGVGQVPVRAADVAGAFEPEPLPDVWDPKSRIPHEDAGRFVKQLAEKVQMNPALAAKVDKWGTELLAMPPGKIRGRHLEQMAGWAANEQAVARGKTKEQAAAEWTDRFFRENGWLAPKRAEQTPAPAPTRTPAKAPAPVPNDGPSMDELAEIEANLPDLMKAGDDIVDEIPIDRIDEWEMQGIRRVNPNLIPDVAPTDPRYQARIHPTKATGLTDPGMFERIYKALAPKLTDHVAVLQMYQNDIAREFLKQTGRRLPPEMMAAALKRLDPNRAAEMDADMYLKPALRAFRRLGYSDATINTYLSYKHDLDIADVTKNPNRKFPDGATLADARAFVHDFENKAYTELSPDDYRTLNDALSMVWSLGDRILKLKEEAGLINSKTYLDLRSRFPFYVKTSILDYLDDDNMVGVGQSLSVSASTLSKLTEAGTERTAVDALPAMLGELYRAHAAANRNRVFNAFVDLWETARALPSTQRLPATSGKVSASERKAGEFGSLVMEWTKPSKPPNDFVTVQGFVDGVKKKYAVHKSLGDVTKYEAPIVIPILSGLSAAFRAGATARNPVFLAANAMLDFSGYLVRESARAGGPQHLIDVTTEYMKVLGEFLLPGRASDTVAGGVAAGLVGAASADKDASPMDRVMRGLAFGAVGATGARVGASWKANKQVWSDIARHEYSGDMQRFLAEGGGSSGAFSGSPFRPNAEWKFTDRIDLGPLMEKLGIKQRSDLEEGIERLGRDFWKRDTAADYAALIWDGVTLKPVEAVGERIELLPRIAAMRLAEKRGASLTEAINAGRTTTIDFQKGGTWTRTINQMVPFFNVGIQATTDMQRAYAENPKAFTASVVTAVVAPTMIAEAWNQADKQRAQDYRDVPDYIKDQGLVVMLPREYFPPAKDAQGNERPQFFHFRYRQFAPISMLTREVMQRAYYDRDLPDEERRSAFDLITSGLNQMSPVPTSDAADFASTFMPVGMGTILQASPQVDRDFFRGRRIRSVYADERASPLSKGIADLTGARPSVVEFVTRDFGTGYAGMLHGASKMIAGDRQASPTTPVPTDTPQDTPVVGGLYGRLIKGSIGGEADRARENVVTPSAEKILSAAKITWRPAPTAPEISNIPLTRSEYGKYQKEINKVTDQVIQQMSRNPGWSSWSAAEKQERIERVLESQRESVRQKMLASIPREVRRKRLEEVRAKDSGVRR